MTHETLPISTTRITAATPVPHRCRGDPRAATHPYWDSTDAGSRCRHGVHRGSGRAASRFEGLDERSPRCVGDLLAVREAEFLRKTLHVVTMDVARMVPGVQHEPELDARIGDRHLDSALPAFFDGLCQLLVLVGIEYAPDLIELRMPAGVVSYVFPRAINQRGGCHSALGKNKLDAAGAVAACPPSEIVAFRDPALRKDTDHSPLFPGFARAARGPTGRSRHDRFGFVASWNSAGSSTGTPP